jgi:hypothetical protein
MKRIESKQDSPQSRLRPASPFSYVGQGLRGHRDFIDPFFQAFLCGLCDSVVKFGLMGLYS